MAQSVRDISSTGLFVLTEDRWFLGTLIMITLQSSDLVEEGEARSITLQARVVRRAEDGLGLEFVLPKPEDSRLAKVRLDVLTDQKTLNNFIDLLNPPVVGPGIDVS